MELRDGQNAESPTAAPRRRPRALVVAAYILYLWVLVELGSWAGLVALSRLKGIEYVPAQLATLIHKHRFGIEGHLAGRDSYVVLDPEIGWTLGTKRSKRGYRTNAAGFRATREYSPLPPPGVLRLAAFGDSFTHASGVANPVSWAARLERRTQHLEVLNFGIPGSAPDQALLRYRREGIGYHPHVVLIGFMSENVSRMVNTFRPFYFPNSGMAFAKPRFGLRGGQLVLWPNPLPDAAAYRRLLADPERELPRVGEHDYFYQRRSRRSRLDLLPSVRMAWVLRERFLDQPIVRGGVYNTRSEAFQVSVEVVDRFYREALAHGSLPVVVLFPQRGDIGDHRDGRPLLYGPLLEAFHARGLLTVDLMGAFDRYDPQRTVMRRKFIHYPPEGNEWVARYLADWLRAQRLDAPSAVAPRVAGARERLRVKPAS